MINIHNNSLLPILCLTAAILFLWLVRPIINAATLSRPRPGTEEFSPVKKTNDLKEYTAAPITIHYHERPPYNITGPQGVHGLSCDPVKKAFIKADIPFKWQKTPAKRQLAILKANLSRDAIVGWFKTPQREAFARFSIPIYQDRPTIALARAHIPFIAAAPSLDTLLAVPHLILLRKSGYSYGQFIDAAIARHAPRQVVTHAENMGMLKMLHAYRADYFFISPEEARFITVASGMLPANFKLIRFTDVPPGNRRHLLFSKKVPPSVIRKINDALETIMLQTSLPPSLTPLPICPPTVKKSGGAPLES